MAPNNLADAPGVCIDFMKQMPTIWDETRFIDGYPGRYVVLARRHGDVWYVAAVNATAEPLKLKLSLPMLPAGDAVSVYLDDKKLQPQQKRTENQNGRNVTAHCSAYGGSGDCEIGPGGLKFA